MLKQTRKTDLEYRKIAIRRACFNISIFQLYEHEAMHKSMQLHVHCVAITSDNRN
jgi:hypothetical protein